MTKAKLMKVPKELRLKISNIEATAYTPAARVLLIGLKHIQEHHVSYPMGVTSEEWFDHIVPELIWYLDMLTDDRWSSGSRFQRRASDARDLLGRHFADIWC